MTTAPRPPRTPAPAARAPEVGLAEMRAALARSRQAAKEAKAAGQLDLLSAAPAPAQPALAVNAAPALQSIKQQIVPDLRPSAQPRPVLEPIAQTQVISNKAKPTTSKRGDLAGLPADWRARLFTATESSREKPSKLRLAVAILWATGCRPAEIEGGVDVQMHEGQLVITIKSAKVGTIDNGEVIAQRGLEVRRVYLDPSRTPATALLARLTAAGPITVQHNKNSLRTRVNELGRLALAKLKNAPSISPYTFRHAVGCDLKSCDTLTDEQRAMAMGHLSTESLTRYGRRRRGGGGQSPFERVEASAVPHGARQPGQADNQADTTHQKQEG